MGRAVRHAWDGTGTAETVVQIARSFFVHPSELRSTTVGHLREMRDFIEAWARRHTQQLNALPSEGDIEALRGWGHTIGEHADALVADPSGYLDRRVDDFQRLQRDTRRLLMQRGRELMDATEEELQQWDAAIRQLYEGAP